MTKDDLFNVADCAIRRAVRCWLEGDTARALRECDTAEVFQRLHSYTQIDRRIPYPLSQ